MVASNWGLEPSTQEIARIESRRSRALLAYAATTRLGGLLSLSPDSRAALVIETVDRVGVSLVDAKSWNEIEQVDADVDEWGSHLDIDGVGPSHLWSRWLSSGFGLLRSVQHGGEAADVQDALASVVEALEGDAEYVLDDREGRDLEGLDEGRWVGALYAHPPLIAELGAQRFDLQALDGGVGRRRGVLEQARRHAMWAAELKNVWSLNLPGS